MSLALRRSIFRATAVALAISCAGPSHAQVGGPPAPPATIWQFLGIPQGIKKLQGATRNRRGNFPGTEPKPPMRAIADPRNLESPDPSIKKAAEVKTAEDLKKQKIKAVKYLAEIGCGCYDADGGVTAALVASMQDCTEDVRYETIQAVADAAEKGACATCGQGCCCKKEILLTLAKLAYERADNGCYLESSERVRQAAAEALETCCPNDSPPVIVPAETPTPPVRRETGETIPPAIPRESGSTLPPPVTPQPIIPDTPPPPVPSAGIDIPAPSVTKVTPPAADQFQMPSGALGRDEDFGFGVLLHVSPQHNLAHVHFNQPNLVAEVGSDVGVYEQFGQERRFLGKLRVVGSFPGSANVTGTTEQLAKLGRGDVVLLPRTTNMGPDNLLNADWVSIYDAPPKSIVRPASAFGAVTQPTQVASAKPVAKSTGKSTTKPSARSVGKPATKAAAGGAGPFKKDAAVAKDSAKPATAKPATAKRSISSYFVR